MNFHSVHEMSFVQYIFPRHRGHSLTFAPQTVALDASVWLQLHTICTYWLLQDGEVHSMGALVPDCIARVPRSCSILWCIRFEMIWCRTCRSTPYILDTKVPYLRLLELNAVEKQFLIPIKVENWIDVMAALGTGTTCRNDYTFN